MKPAFWKLSMGPGNYGRDFKQLLEVLDWLRQGLVLAYRHTGRNQGEKFFDNQRIGDYFYLCHGNNKPSVILVGQFTGPAVIVSFPEHKRWVARPFRWIKTAILTKQYKGKKSGWTPDYPSTFQEVREDQLKEFESLILRPYFRLKLADFGFDL